jgi:uncharacterized repeat protein (TIGR03803 family)
MGGFHSDPGFKCKGNVTTVRAECTVIAAPQPFAPIVAFTQMHARAGGPATIKRFDLWSISDIEIYRQSPAQAYNFHPTLFLTTAPGARIVDWYVALHTSSESFPKSRFCLSGSFLLLAAVHNPSSAKLSWTQKENAMPTPTRQKKFFANVLIALSTLLVASHSAQAQTETVLYNFVGGSDGANPQSRLTSAGNGNFYGTTYGGASGAGTVFELSPNGSGGWNETGLHSFSGGLNIGPDGSGPSGPVIFDSVGNLYGTTRFGGTDYFYCSYGTLFELSPAGSSWTETVLFSESCTQPSSTGAFPVNGMIMDPAGHLFGTTSANGGLPGTVFELSPSAGGWTEQVIYSTGGETPTGLTMDAGGNIFGATPSTVFELWPTQSGVWNAKILHNFMGYPYDGIAAVGTLVLRQGRLYGTTQRGGAYDRGTVYKLSLRANGAWTEDILYSFPGGKKGTHPMAGIAIDAVGNIYGTTELGGTFGLGTVFELADLGSSHYQNVVLWSFSGNDGKYPLASLILDGERNLYGTTSLGGSSNAGVVFKVSGVRDAPSTSFTSSLNPSTYGQKVTFQVTVRTSGTLPPTGTIAFTWQSFTQTYTIGTVTLDSSGVATLVKSNLNADVYPMNAVYRGDANNLGSWSPVLNQSVRQTTSAATITSSPNPSTVGQAITFTAKIASPTVTPSGPVTFKAGTTVLGTAQLSSGKAVFTTSTLPAGLTVVKVTYNGNSNIKGSSASVTQTVKP